MKQRLLRLYRWYIQYCARRTVRRTRPYIIGITGSVGKTTARLIIAQTIEQLLPDISVITSPKNFNGDLGFALSVLGIESFTPSVGGYLRGLWQATVSMFVSPAVDVMVLEYGIDHPGEMQQLLRIAQPDVGVITRIDAVHSQQMGDPTQIAEQKRMMIDQSRDVVFLNRDDVYIQQMADRTDADILWYSIDHGDQGDVGYEDITLVEDNGSIVSEVTIFAGDISRSGRVSVLSKALVSYVSLGISISSVIAYRRVTSLSDVERLDYILQPGRLSLLAGIGDTMIIDSSYNASPASMESMLGIAYRIKQDVSGDNRPLIGIIGDMRELGDLSEQMHRRLAGVLSQGLDMIVLVGEEVLHTIDELQKIGYPKNKIRHFISSREAGEWVREMIDHDSTRHTSLIFVKGSQNTIYLEEAIKPLLADPADSAKLGRQEDRWMEKKEKFFSDST